MNQRQPQNAATSAATMETAKAVLDALTSDIALKRGDNESVPNNAYFTIFLENSHKLQQYLTVDVDSVITMLY